MDPAKENLSTVRRIAEILLDIKAVKVSMKEPFTWVSGIKSPVYCDNRKLISYPKERQAVVDAFIQLIQKGHRHPDYIAGTATAAIPWAAFTAYELNLPMIYIRPEKKEHGMARQVEGYLPAGKKVLIIEDLISTGGSSVSAAEAVRRECNAEVENIFAIVTWELEESKQNFQRAGLKLETLTNFTNIIGLAREKNLISEDEHGKILLFRENPRNWAQKMGLLPKEGIELQVP